MHTKVKEKLKKTPFDIFHGDKIPMDGENWKVPKRLTNAILCGLPMSKGKCEKCGAKKFTSVWDFIKYVKKHESPEEAFLNLRNLGPDTLPCALKLWGFVTGRFIEILSK
jgi:hypothetical protein